MKRVSQKMISINYYRPILKLVLIIFFTISAFSCSDDGDPPLTFNEIPQNIKDLIYFNGDEKASKVVITVPGGPSTELASELVDYFSANFNTTDILNITVHQAQTLNPNIIEGNEITLGQAVNFNAESIETLHHVVKYFKDEGRTVYIAAFSFGSFVTQELIAKKGIDVADEYLIISGRLDINDVMWQGLADGKNAYFENGVTPIVEAEQFEQIFQRNEARLFAGLGMNRYTEQFNTIESLFNLTYIYGETDEAVGSLTNEEVTFLQSKNANILSGTGGHDEPFEGFMEQGFSEAFGIE